MIYIEYHKSRLNYIKAYNQLCEVEEQREKLFQRTQPQGTKFDKNVVSGGVPHDSYADYLIASEEMDIEEKLNNARKNYHQAALTMGRKLQALKNSMITEDRIYYLKNCRQRTISQIAAEFNRSESQIYRIMEQMVQDIDRAC